MDVRMDGGESSVLSELAPPEVTRTLAPLHFATRRVALPLLFAFAGALFRNGVVRLVLPDGTEVALGDVDDERSLCIRVVDERALWRWLALPTDVDMLGDAYVQGEVEFSGTADLLQAVLLHGVGRGPVPSAHRRARAHDLMASLGRQLWSATVLALRPDSLSVDEPPHACAEQSALPLVDALEPLLDPTLSRSAALYPNDARARAPYDSSRPAAELGALHAAQLAKLDAALDALGPVEGALSVLEIGCGYGSLALRALERFRGPMRWVGLTRSPRQASVGRARVRAARAEHAVSLQLLDEPGDLLATLLGAADGASLAGAGVAGAFDRVVCIEEEELTALGQVELRRLLFAVSRALMPGGIAVLQAVLASPRGGVANGGRGGRALECIRARLSLGGEPPSEREMCALARESGLQRATIGDAPRSLRASYAKTLQVWRARLAMSAYSDAEEAAAGRALDFRLGLWEAAFRVGLLDVRQLRFVKVAPSDVAACETGETAVAASSAKGQRVRSLARAVLAPAGLGIAAVKLVPIAMGRLLRKRAKAALQLSFACAITATLWTALTIDGIIHRCQEASPALALCTRCSRRRRW